MTFLFAILLSLNANAETPKSELAKLFLEVHNYTERYISGAISQATEKHSVFDEGEYSSILGRVATTDDVVKSKILLKRIYSKYFNEIDIQKNTEFVYSSLFTEEEILQLLKFYKTDLGKKLLLSQASVGKLLAKRNAESFKEANSEFVDDFVLEMQKVFPDPSKNDN